MLAPGAVACTASTSSVCSPYHSLASQSSMLLNLGLTCWLYCPRREHLRRLMFDAVLVGVGEQRRRGVRVDDRDPDARAVDPRGDRRGQAVGALQLRRDVAARCVGKRRGVAAAVGRIGRVDVLRVIGRARRSVAESRRLGDFLALRFGRRPRRVGGELVRRGDVLIDAADAGDQGRQFGGHLQRRRAQAQQPAEVAVLAECRAERLLHGRGGRRRLDRHAIGSDAFNRHSFGFQPGPDSLDRRLAR